MVIVQVASVIKYKIQIINAMQHFWYSQFERELSDRGYTLINRNNPINVTSRQEVICDRWPESEVDAQCRLDAVWSRSKHTWLTTMFPFPSSRYPAISNTTGWLRTHKKWTVKFYKVFNGVIRFIVAYRELSNNSAKFKGVWDILFTASHINWAFL